MFSFSSAKFLGCATFFCYATFFRSENFVAQHFISVALHLFSVALHLFSVALHFDSVAIT